MTIRSKKSRETCLEDLVFFVRTGDGLIQAQIDFVGRIDLAVLDLRHDRAEGLEVVDQGLVDEDVPVRQEQDALDLARLPQAPDDLEGRVGLAGAGCHDQQYAFLAAGDGLDGAVDRLDLIVARLLAAKRPGGKAARPAFLLRLRCRDTSCSAATVFGERGRLRGEIRFRCLRRRRALCCGRQRRRRWN